MDEQERTQRIETQSINEISVLIPNEHMIENYYFPICLDQVRELKSKIYTRLEMLNLSKKSEDAAKVVFNDMIWDWFGSVQENSTTSYKGCIAPIVMEKHKDSKFYPSNRWGWKNEEEYNDAQPKAVSVFLAEE